MKALVYIGSSETEIKDRPSPRLVHSEMPSHLEGRRADRYAGRRVISHEGVGVIDSVGTPVTLFKKGDQMKSVLAAILSSKNFLRLDWMREAVLGLFSPRMSAVAFHLDYFVFPPVIVFSLAVSIRSLNTASIAVLFFGGLVAWSLAEYLLHRFVLHHWPYFRDHHKAHHDSPRSMIGAPTLFTLAFFAAGFCLPLWLLAGEAIALSSFAGFLTGYVAFGTVHHAVHHSEGQGLLLRHFKRLHAIHHHGSRDRNFGVLTSFWDRVFGTYSSRVTRR